MVSSNKIKLVAGVLLLSAVFYLKTTNIHAGVATGKFLGNIIANSVPANFATYWNQVTPENSTKWGSVESSRDNMNWTAANTAYGYAKKNGLSFKFHTLVWGSQQPGWIGGLSITDQKAEVVEWIQAAGARYSEAEFVDVVNEPLHAPPSYKNAIGGDGSTGWDWIIWSFQEARKAFPNSKLLINEYGIISDPSATAKYVTIINLLRARGLVDGIGIQCHCFNMDTVATSTMRSVLNTLSATGLPIYVSELDITGDDATQLARYKEKFPVLWEHSAVQGITLWGYIEGQTWKANTHLISRSGVERSALKWLRQYCSVVAPSPNITVTPTRTPVATPTPTRSAVVTPSPSATSTTGCSVAYLIQNGWDGGATVNVSITNHSSTAINGWTLEWTFAGNQKILNLWNGSYTQSGNAVAVKDGGYNGVIAANGGTVSFGFSLSYSGTNTTPTIFKLNGAITKSR